MAALVGWGSASRRRAPNLRSVCARIWLVTMCGRGWGMTKAKGLGRPLGPGTGGALPKPWGAPPRDPQGS